MRKFTPDPERENEALWGSKEGFLDFVKRNSIPLLENKEK